MKAVYVVEKSKRFHDGDYKDVRDAMIAAAAWTREMEALGWRFKGVSMSWSFWKNEPRKWIDAFMLKDVETEAVE